MVCYLEHFLKQIAGHDLRGICDSVSLGKVRVCVLNKFLDDVGTACLRTIH